ncbi:MAG TPA: adenylate/guanylate cyclase domain-containing protein [Aggregatilineales bacterium]|nr:adenylate/guanylate cyclase domain-containing protein [Aggregatilineales bacterium]
MQSSASASPIASIEPRLRSFLPADLYATVWLDPSPASLMRVFEHLRTLQRILGDYISRQVLEALPQPGEIRFAWQDGTLMFTDLAGFTPLLEANAAKGAAGARTLLQVLNSYFAGMIEVISRSGGNVLEFTGDAMLAQFPTLRRRNEAAQAIRAGLRMQRTMANFAKIETGQGEVSLGMRVGLHSGRFLTADVGTPRRMDHVLLGHAVREAKRAEGAGKVGRVCLTPTVLARVGDEFRSEPGNEECSLVIDDLTTDQLGDFELSTFKRMTTSTLMDRSVEGLMESIVEGLTRVESMASYLPASILRLLVESTTRREIAPDFPIVSVMFINLIGLSEVVDDIAAGAETSLISAFSRIFTLINAATESRGGVLKKVTYHLSGSDIMVIFGAPESHTDDAVRAADAALAIEAIVAAANVAPIGGKDIAMTCKIGIATGPVFSGEIGEPRGRREFNVLGDTVNTAARLMSKAGVNQVLITEAVQRQLGDRYATEAMGTIPLKGKSVPINLFLLTPRAAK